MRRPIVLEFMPSDCITNDSADNARIVPDLSASGTSDLFIKATEWIVMDDIAKHLYICVVALHKVIRNDRPGSTNKVLFHHHQACAAKRLQERITQVENVGPNPEILEATTMFLSTQIQGSAYSPWKVHINGAKALLEKWGFRSLLGRCDFAYYVLLMTDTYGTTMVPSRLLSLEKVEQHLLYLDMIESVHVDTLTTLTPIPTDIIKATVRINIYRISAAIRPDVPCDPVIAEDTSPSFIMDALREFDPLVWASNLPPHALAEHDSWVMLAACFQHATMLYVLMVCNAGTANKTSLSELSEGARSHIYQELVAGIHDLLKRKRHGGTHYKFIFWAMVICGVEAAVKQDRIELQFLHDALQETTLDLGTLAMREAAEFLLEVWNHCEQRLTKSQRVDIVWDTVFERAPVFLM